MSLSGRFPDAHSSAQKQDKHTTSSKRDQPTMSDLDERLERIENRVEMLLERQRLSHFDNLMFLAYPIVILGITLSLTLSIQYEAMKSVLVFGVPLNEVVFGICYVFLSGFGVAFLIFGIGYAKDSLHLRLTSLRFLLGGLASLANAIALIISWRTLSDILSGLQAIFPTNTVRLVILTPFLVAWLGIVALGTERFVRRVASWLEKSIPEILKEARFPWMCGTNCRYIA
jgi:hypothetical protein